MKPLTILFLLLWTTSIAQDKRLGNAKLPVGTERRAAVIFANQDYEANSYDLTKTYNDADDMKTTLEGMGFDIISFKKDMTRTDFYREIQSLTKKLQEFQVVFFYYSGHGVEYQGENYLIPTDIPRIQFFEDIKAHGFPLSNVYQAFEVAALKTSILILDACRSLPIGKGSLPAGMSVPRNSPAGTFTFYATRSGEIALENYTGRNSYLTQELLKYLPSPESTLNQIYYQTRQGVRKATNERQVPGISNELDGEFLFLEKIAMNTEIDISNTTLEILTVAKKGEELYNQKKYEEALPFITRAAEQGDAESQTILGIMYWEAKGVAKDINKSMFWNRKAANQGYSDGEHNMGVYYQFGEGVPKNNKTALEWYLKAAEKGHGLSNYRIGEMYELGQGVIKSKIIAIKYYRFAAQQENKQAKIALTRLKKTW